MCIPRSSVLGGAQPVLIRGRSLLIRVQGEAVTPPRC